MVGGPDLKHTKVNHHVRDKETRREAAQKRKYVCVVYISLYYYHRRLSVRLLQYRFGYAICCLTWVPYMPCFDAVSM